MVEKKPEDSDSIDIFKKWVRSNLTGSMRKTGAAGMLGTNAVPELEEVINEIRQGKINSQVSQMDRPKQLWLNAISTCNFSETEKLLQQDSSLLNWKNPFNGTALHYAAKEGNVKCLNYLMGQENVDINAQCRNGWTPLHVAVFYSQRLFIRTLVENHKARNDIMDYSGKFPVDLLATEEMKEDFSELLSRGRVAKMRKHIESLWKSSKTSVCCKKADRADSSKLCELEAYNELLLSTLGRDHDYVANMYRRLHRRNFAHTTPESLLAEIRGGDTEDRKTKKKGRSLKRGSAFKVSLLPYPAKNIASGGVAMANAAASGLLKVGEVVKKGLQKQMDDGRKRESMKITQMSSNSTLNVWRRHERKHEARAGHRHSIGGIEQLASRMNVVANIGAPIQVDVTSNVPVANWKFGGVFRRPSNLSDVVANRSSVDGEMGESPSSTLSIVGGMQRTSSQSSLVTRTQELLNQYLSPPSPIPSPQRRSSGSPSKL